MTAQTDPFTRYFHITYAVPAGAPDQVTVRCSWSPAGQDEWHPAVVRPYLSDTAARLTPDSEWKRWVGEGELTERRAAGLQRAVIFNPYPEAEVAGQVAVDFRVQVLTTAAEELAVHRCRLQADNRDVICLEDWTKVLQQDALADNPKPEDRKWRFRTDLKPEEYSRGNALFGSSPADVPLPQLTYPLDLKGPYAIFVRTLAHGSAIQMRLSGEDRCDLVESNYPRHETFWRWATMDRQHLVLRQHHNYTGYVTSALDYVRLVPLTPALVQRLEQPFAGKRDKCAAFYWEPYSFAFSDDVRDNSWHREKLTAYAEARADLVDAQLGRFGDKAVYESRRTDPLYYGTYGDPIGKTIPQTTNVGRMQQFTNTLEAELRAAHDLGLNLHANFGATSCYPGTALESDFSKAHPEWRQGNCLKYNVPEVRQYILSLYREMLEIGAPGISIDYCRYPDGLDQAATVTAFHRELRALTGEFAARRKQPVPILVRFPATGVRQCEMFDYRTWAKEGLVDYLCPSNLQGRHHHFALQPYLAAVKGTRCKLLPVVDGLGWGPQFPGMFLWRVKQCYDAGTAGVYVYQGDSRVLGRPEDRRVMRMLGSSEAVARWWQHELAERSHYSKTITITPPMHLDAYSPWERLRIWTDGLPLGPLEVYLDDRLVSKFAGPPYLVGTEDYQDDKVISAGEHTLRVRARDGDGWLEQTFTVKGH